MPSLATVHIDTALTNVLIKRPRQEFVSRIILPPIPVKHRSDYVFKVDSNNETERATDDLAAPGVEPNKVDFDVDSSTHYKCTKHALMTSVPDEEVNDADEPLRPFIAQVDWLDDKLALNEEVACLAKLIATLTGDQTSSPANKWENASLGDPIGDLKAKLLYLAQNAGVRANTVVMDYTVLSYISEHPDFLDRVKSNTQFQELARIGAAVALGAILTVRPQDPVTVLVPGGVKNTAIKGQTASFASIWGEYVALLRVEPPKLGTAAFGCTPVWTTAPGTIQGGGVKRVRHEMADAEDMSVTRWYDQIALNSAAGYLFSDVLGV